MKNIQLSTDWILCNAGDKIEKTGNTVIIKTSCKLQYQLIELALKEQGFKKISENSNANNSIFQFPRMNNSDFEQDCPDFFANIKNIIDNSLQSLISEDENCKLPPAESPEISRAEEKHNKSEELPTELPSILGNEGRIENLPDDMELMIMIK